MGGEVLYFGCASRCVCDGGVEGNPTKKFEGSIPGSFWAEARLEVTTTRPIQCHGDCVILKTTYLLH